MSLLSKAVVVYCVDCTYSRKSVVACVTTFLVFLVATCSLLSVIGFTPDLIAYAMIMMGIVFSVVFAYAIVVCNIGIVVCVLEEVSGPQAMLQAGVLMKGQTQVGLLIFLRSQLVWHSWVKVLSYGDGSSRIWEGPMMLVNSMMNTVLYFSCRSYTITSSGGECQSILEAP